MHVVDPAVRACALASKYSVVMLSVRSFQLLQKIFLVKIVGIECCGPLWREGKKHVRSAEKADFRVLLEKKSDALVRFFK